MTSIERTVTAARAYLRETGDDAHTMMSDEEALLAHRECLLEELAERPSPIAARQVAKIDTALVTIMGA